MPDNVSLKALILGDIIGHPGSRALFTTLKKIKNDYKADLVIVNGENAADGFGIMPKDVENFFSYGVDVITSGNHIWQRAEILPLLDSEERLLRPANYPAGVKGHGHCTVDVHGTSVAVVNLQGRVRMSVNSECPFKEGMKLVKKLQSKCPVILVDFHAEDTIEKESLAAWLDGHVSAVVGTHTHVQTADERILDKGTAYITDIGLTGAERGIIGSDPEPAIKRVLTTVPHKSVVMDGSAVIQGVFLEIDSKSGKALKIERISVPSGV